jgi:hypothetical protein
MVRGVERFQRFGGIPDADAIGRLAQLRVPAAGRPRILDFDLQLCPVMVALNANRSAPYMTGKDLGYESTAPVAPFLVNSGKPDALMVVIPDLNVEVK